MDLRCDRLWRDARLATLAASGRSGLGEIADGLIACRDGLILYAGAADDAPRFDPAETIACDGRWITPGLIDCHTHLVFGGDRAGEFEMRLAGASYEAIARAGGGIVSTMAATRAASEEDLLAAALPRLDALIAEGATTVEVKSGYGLSLADELKQLRVARALERHRDVAIATTLLGAHALPPELASDADGYIDLVCEAMIPAVAAEGLADAVDAFSARPSSALRPPRSAACSRRRRRRACRSSCTPSSSPISTARRWRPSFALCRPITWNISTKTAPRAWPRAGVVATVLPGAFYFVRETRVPPIEVLRRAGVPIALATDCNPGTSPLTSLLMTMNMGATLFRLTVEECIAGVTRNAAQALGLEREIGTLETGKQCDLAIWDIERPAELVYRIGFNPLHARVWSGK